jgi:hypothetical protein
MCFGKCPRNYIFQPKEAQGDRQRVFLRSKPDRPAQPIGYMKLVGMANAKPLAKSIRVVSQSAKPSVPSLEALNCLATGNHGAAGTRRDQWIYAHS